MTSVVNSAFVDDYFDGLILHICTKGFISLETKDGILLKIAAGEKWSDLIAYTKIHGYQGLECLAGIPGTVGAAPIQNIGAYGMELKDVFIECEVFDVEKKMFLTFNQDQCQLTYRNSRMKKDNQFKLTYIITEVTIQVSKSAFDEDKLDDILHRRAKILPDLRLGIGTAGRFFANPIVSIDRYEILEKIIQGDLPHYSLKNNQVKLSAGWLIEQCGWKGRSLGSAGVWHAHSNVLVHRGLTNGSDLWQLAKEIRCNVQHRFDIQLESEVNIIRLFLPIQNLLSSAVILKKSDRWKDENRIETISIPADKNVCVHLLFAAVALRRPVQIIDDFPSHMVQDIQRILHWIDHYHVANLHFQTSDHHRTLIITPTDECLPDLTTASFSRASIGIGGSILLREGQVRCIDLGGCQFTKRPIDRHLDLLVALGGVTEDGEIYRLEKCSMEKDEEFQFDCRTKSGVASVGVTIHAILCCCVLPSNVECLLTSVTLELSVQIVMELARQTRSIIVNESKRTILFPKYSMSSKSTQLIIKHLPIDQNYLFTICSLAAMFRLKLFISNFEYDRCITEYLKSILSITMNDNQTTALIDGTRTFLHQAKDKHQLICDIYPDGLPTDISPILTALFIAREVSFELTDRIYDIRNSQCREFTKLGYELITNGNQISYNALEQLGKSPRKINEEHFYAHDIRSGAAILLLALYHVNHQPYLDNRQILLHQYEQIERGYGILLHRQLNELGFDVQFTR